MHSSRSTAFGKNQTLQLLFLTLWVLEICGFMTNSYHRHRLSCPISQIQITAKHYGKKLWMNTDENSTKGFGSTSIPKPNIITPAKGSQHTQLDKFLMMYTCKICSGRNAQMVTKVAYQYGMVVSTCKHCRSNHLIADNQGKLDMQEFGSKIEDYLIAKGESVQKLSITPKELEDNYICDKDGVVTLIPKMGGQPPLDVSIVDLEQPIASGNKPSDNGSNILPWN